MKSLNCILTDKLEQPCRKTKDDARYWEITTRKSPKGGAIDSSNRGKHDNSAHHWETERPGYVINTTPSIGRDGNSGSNSKPQITLGERTSAAPGGIICQPCYISPLISVLLTKLLTLVTLEES